MRRVRMHSLFRLRLLVRRYKKLFVFLCVAAYGVSLLYAWFNGSGPKLCAVKSSLPTQQNKQRNTDAGFSSLPNSQPVRRMCALSRLPGVVLITSAGSRLINSGAMSLLQQPSHFPLNIFHEDSWDIVHKRDPIARSVFENRDVCLVDIFEAEPWLWDSIKVGGELDEFYAFAGAMEPCDQPLKIKSGKLLIRKIAAIRHTLYNVPNGTSVVWLDTDVLLRKPVDTQFLDFVRQFDVTYIPFTTNKLWNHEPKINFQDISSPFWRIESGVTVFTANSRSRKLLDEVISLYRGKLLQRVRACLSLPHGLAATTPCGEPWFRRNAYLDDIFVFSLALHESKNLVKQGWFSVGRGPQCPRSSFTHHAFSEEGVHPYPFPHVCQSQTSYTSPFDLELYFRHQIGNGAYSKVYRGGGATAIDSELKFIKSELFNDTLEFRFPGSTSETLEDSLWDVQTLQRRKDAGLWPPHLPLTLPSKRSGKPKMMATKQIDTLRVINGTLWHAHPLLELSAASQQAGVHARSRGAIVLLSQNKKHSSYNYQRKMSQSLDTLYKYYNNAQGDDVWVMHEGDFDSRAQNWYTSRYCGLQFYKLDGLNWEAYPPYFADPRTWQVQPNWEPFSLGYRKMIRWYAIRLWHVMHDMGYEYVMRLDDDSFFFSEIPYNIFDFMATNNMEYAYRNVARESGETGDEWYKFLRSYHAESGLKSTGWLLETCSQAHSMSDYKASKCGESFGFYNNFFVAKVSFFLSPAVQDFLNAVDESGNIFKWRWNDLIIQAAAVQLFMPQEKVHRFVGWAYAHFSGPLTRKTDNYGILQSSAFDVSPVATVMAFSAKNAMNLETADLVLLNGTLVTFSGFVCTVSHKMCLA